MCYFSSSKSNYNNTKIIDQNDNDFIVENNRNSLMPKCKICCTLYGDVVYCGCTINKCKFSCHIQCANLHNISFYKYYYYISLIYMVIMFYCTE